MSGRSALPGLMTGILSLLTGLIAVAFEQQVFAGVAGLLGLAAGVAGVRLAQQLDEQAAIQRLVEDELRAVRSESQEIEERLRSELDAVAFGDVDGSGAGADALTDASTGLFSESFFNVRD